MLWIIVSACVVLGAALLMVHVRLLNGGLYPGPNPLHRIEKCPWCAFPVRQFRKSRVMKFGKQLCPNCGRLMVEK